MHIEWHDVTENGKRYHIMRVGSLAFGVIDEVPIKSWFKRVGTFYRPRYLPEVLQLACDKFIKDPFMGHTFENLDATQMLLESLTTHWVRMITWEPEAEVETPVVDQPAVETPDTVST